MAGRRQGERGESLALGGGRTALHLPAEVTVPRTEIAADGAPRGERAAPMRAQRLTRRWNIGAPYGAPFPLMR